MEETSELQAQDLNSPSALFDSLREVIHAYNPDADLDTIHRAYEFAEMAHDGQFRGTGEPYITHPLHVAFILAEMHLDVETIEAALLHDTIQDTAATNEDITHMFGPIVAHLVEGVTKLNSVSNILREAAHIVERKKQNAVENEREIEKSRTGTRQGQVESMRKMFLAMFDDPRVVLIKLADRLHNMRTLQGLAPVKQQRIAAQTLEIYASLANHLGLSAIKGELEDLSFRYLDPEKFVELSGMIKETESARDQYLKRVIETLNSELEADSLKVTTNGRVKHIFSLWQKMQRLKCSMEHIYDVLAVRIIVDSVKDCYAVLGLIHSLWLPIPNAFKDYIARPKESMYQSLHTAVWALDNKPLEIQIRTYEMHEIAEYGIAAHWRYKEPTTRKRDYRYEQKIAWLHRLMSWRNEVDSAQDFVESLKSDLFQDHIYVFTPNGDVVELPKGATPIDFAYRIHTELGHQINGAMINERLVTLDTPLENGAVVRIMKDNNRVGPPGDWLHSERLIKTGNARRKVRQSFNRQSRDWKIVQGRDILDQAIKHLGLTNMAYIDVLEYFPRYKNLDAFLEAIGKTDINIAQLTSKISEHRQKVRWPKVDNALMTVPTTIAALSVVQPTMQVSELGGILTVLAKCCKPMPGDEIIGYNSRGRGIIIHRSDCKNLSQILDVERIVRVNWGEQNPIYYPAHLRIKALDRALLLYDVTTMLAHEKVEILSVLTQRQPSSAVTTLIMDLQVVDTVQLNRIMGKIEAIRGIFEVLRDLNAPEIRQGVR